MNKRFDMWSFLLGVQFAVWINVIIYVITHG